MNVTDLYWLSNTVRSIYVARTYNELSQCITEKIHEHFRSSVSLWEWLSPDFTQYGCDHALSNIKVLSGYEPYIWDNPNMVRLIANDQTTVMQSTEAGHKLKSTEYFNEICRPHGIEDQMLSIARERDRITTFSVNRPKRFSGSERYLFELLRPHFGAGLGRLGTRKGWKLTELGERWIELSADLRPLGLSATQRAALRLYFPGWTSRSHLPEEIGKWTKSILQRLKNEAVTPPLRLLSKESARGTLYCRFFPHSGPGGAIQLQERPAQPNFFAAGKFLGLSPRQSEVLHFLAQGKRDAEIALILSLSSKTASKHVEHILKKLGVHTRAAAVATAHAVAR